MNQPPVQPANFSRLNSASEEMERRKKEVLAGVMEAIKASEEGNDHPLLRTPEKRRAWVDEGTELRLERFFSFLDAVERNHQSNKNMPQDMDANSFYPEWTRGRYHGD